MKRPKVGGLCSGVGGIELGFKQAGFDIAWANEMDEKACITYRHIHKIELNDHLIHSTLEELLAEIKSKPQLRDLQYVDVLTAGFPCQAFSVAGYRKGFNDERGNVFFKIAELLDFFKKEKKLPKALLLENVKNFKTHDRGKTFKTVCEHLKTIGYSVYTRILNTCDYTDIPQNRERTFMVCFLDEKDWQNDYLLTMPEDKLIKNFPQTFYFHKNFPKKNDKLIPLQEIYEKDIQSDFYYNDNRYMYNKLKKSMRRKDTIYQWRRVYVRENQSGMCPTLTANMGTGGHNVPLILTDDNRFRKLTPKECFNFQGYPKKIKLPDLAKSHLYKQAGNSVTVKLIKMLAKNIKNAICQK